MNTGTWKSTSISRFESDFQTTNFDFYFLFRFSVSLNYYLFHLFRLIILRKRWRNICFMAAIASRTDTKNSSADTESPSMRLIEFAKLFKPVTDVWESISVKKSVLIAKDMNLR